MSILSLKFPFDHPCGAGHFPGNPIIPGALLLDEVLGAIGKQPDITGIGWHVKSAKFPQPVRPGDEVHIDYTQMVNGEIRFECTVVNNKVLSGVASSRGEIQENDSP